VTCESIFWSCFCLQGVDNATLFDLKGNSHCSHMWHRMRFFFIFKLFFHHELPYIDTFFYELSTITLDSITYRGGTSVLAKIFEI
jgi:hypothetical protein